MTILAIGIVFILKFQKELLKENESRIKFCNKTFSINTLKINLIALC